MKEPRLWKLQDIETQLHTDMECPDSFIGFEDYRQLKRAYEVQAQLIEDLIEGCEGTFEGFWESPGGNVTREALAEVAKIMEGK